MMERRSRMVSGMRTAAAILAMTVGLLALSAPADATTTRPSQSKAEVHGGAVAAGQAQAPAEVPAQVEAAATANSERLEHAVAAGQQVVDPASSYDDSCPSALVDAQGTLRAPGGSTQVRHGEKGTAARFAGTHGATTTPAHSLVTPRGAGLVDDAARTGRAASTSWGRTVQDFRQHGDQWRRVSAHAEGATGRTYRGGTSIEEVFERGVDRLIRHRIYGPNGEILHETFRPYAKFGGP